ncbi:unnamed protein product [Angiostrongylus costaricensis]|uniref:Notch n=1 Tax=Angiostrongylus costaricensis TaxID=334426 RepID=A0A158PLD3_ANGCS|nr:unnamed protein product [Angiostrongylus costaricensis]
MILRILLVFLLRSAFGDRELSRCPYDFVCHNGLCDSNERCQCTPGWTGEQCEVELCPSYPCVNGYCNATEDGRKTCQCDHRFEGQYCELDRDECTLRPCPADAECVNHVAKHKKDKGYSCLCPIGYTGEFCEVEGENYCYNGGICDARYVCICEDGCPERPEVCAKVFDNGQCDEVCNRESCLFDGFDCVKHDDFVCRNPSDCAYKYGDGHCDDDCAGAECGFDGGDCNGSKNTFRGRNVNIIGVALGLPPDVAVKNLRQLQAELAQWCYSIIPACVLKSFCQRLYTHVSLAQDVDGVMVYEWSSDHGQGNRVVLNEELASAIQTTATGTIIFFDVDTSACRLKIRRNNSQPHCFTDLRAAATYLALELTRFRPISGKTLPIRDVTWKQKQIVGYPGCSYQPPTPPYSASPENGNNEEYSHSKDAENSLAPIIDAESPLLSAVRRGDLKAVKEMISSKEAFMDTLFERNAAGQSPLLFAARMAHPGLECISILVSSIIAIRRHRHDDVLSGHFSDIGNSRAELIKSLPLHDEGDVKYALTDSMGDAPIHLAARGGNVEAVVALIHNNCDLTAKDAFGMFSTSPCQEYDGFCRLYQNGGQASSRVVLSRSPLPSDEQNSLIAFYMDDYREFWKPE